MIIRSEPGDHGLQQDALTITSHNNASNDSTIDQTTSMSILAPGDNQSAGIYFGTQYLSEKFRARKAAIIVKGNSDYERSNIHFCTENTTDDNDVTIDDSRMIITSDGSVGIGTTTPEYPLQVIGGIFSSSGVPGSLFYAKSDSHNNTSSTYTNTTISIKCDKGIWALILFASSDRRIKENIVDVSDNQALEMVRNIPCRYYEYKDKISRGTEKTIGFIAQEVREVMPMAVNLQTNFVPDEMRLLTDISWNGTTLYTDISG